MMLQDLDANIVLKSLMLKWILTLAKTNLDKFKTTSTEQPSILELSLEPNAEPSQACGTKS